MATDLVGQAFPAKTIYVSATNLFQVAAKELGDATKWALIAKANGLVDPWVTGLTKIDIPRNAPSTGGVYDG